jgi:splicing factor 3A subunit 1
MSMKHPSDGMDDEPHTKKLRTEDSLIPEQQFLARNKVNIYLCIKNK